MVFFFCICRTYVTNYGPSLFRLVLFYTLTFQSVGLTPLRSDDSLRYFLLFFLSSETQLTILFSRVLLLILKDLLKISTVDKKEMTNCIGVRLRKQNIKKQKRVYKKYYLSIYRFLSSLFSRQWLFYHKIWHFSKT